MKRSNDLRFGRGLKRLMEREEITIAEMEEWSGVSCSTISRTRLGVQTPHRGTMEALAAVFRMRAEEVIRAGEEEVSEAPG